LNPASSGVFIAWRYPKAAIAIFDDEAVSVSSLTAAINEQQYQPGGVSRLGLFQEEGTRFRPVSVAFRGWL